MANVTLKNNPIHTVGELPKVGSPGPNFRLTRGDLSDLSLAGFEGKVEILNIVPTLDTGVGAALARARACQPAGNTGVRPETARYSDPHDPVIPDRMTDHLDRV